MKFRFLPGHTNRQMVALRRENDALKSVVGLLADSHVATLEHFAQKTRTQFGKGGTPWNKGRTSANRA